MTLTTSRPFAEESASYDPTAIEEKWQARWQVQGTNRADLDDGERPYYVLMMFPYPSAEGLHIGNLFAFTGNDIHGRFQRLQGHNVFEPIGFDAFGRFPEQERTGDKGFRELFERVGGEGIPIEELKDVFTHKALVNYELVQGDVCDTIPKYVSEHPELTIALLHIDVAVYKPSVVILNELYDRVVRGGLVIFDDFGTVAGETRAIEEFFEGKDVLIEKLPISHIPAYIRKR